METSNEFKKSNFELGRITGVFDRKEDAEQVFDALRDRGYETREIDLIMTDETRSRYYGASEGENRGNLGDKAMEGAGVGSAIGGTIGAIVGAIAALGTTLALPGIGLIVAGPIAAALAGAGAGGLTGGLLGALVGSGIPEEHAKDYETRIKAGGTAIAIRPHSVEDANFIRGLFDRNSDGQVYDEHYQSRSDKSEFGGDASVGLDRNPSWGDFRGEDYRPEADSGKINIPPPEKESSRRTPDSASAL